ncbi:hypothetical protein GPECTOR_1g72 [Gonium pectorale]|uniref:Cytochrome P450 n=1 Tax=Gonium pectorale TaxID=33097 RepID=A0A150H3T1_GONPE|nr:hypothetical protein GPECTOR_1g72 [Gonium pectorale]|eukprot:KXZ56799.1 hypothetical protein GPECTOR_1g72 [Gonium pectorale]
MMGSRIWMINDTQALRAILKDENAGPEVPFPTFKALMGEETLLRSHPNGAHPNFRKVFLAAVGPQALSAMAPRVVAAVNAHLPSWERAGKFPLFRAARLLGVDMAVDVIMQIQLPPGVDRDDFKRQVETFFDGIYSLPIALPGTDFSRALAAKTWLLEVLQHGVRELHTEFIKQWDAVGQDIPAYAAKVLEHAAAATAEQAPAGAAASSPSSLALTPSIHLSQLLVRAAFKRFGLQDAALGILHMLVGSGDTTRFGLFNSWALIAMSPRVQDKIFEEQQQVVAQHGPGLTHEASLDMRYLEATLKECMRILPASAGGIRRLAEDVRVGGGYVIPKGETVWYHAGLLHCTDPALWDGRTDCELPPHMDWRHNFEEAFCPERWLGGEEAGRPRSYYNFGAGAHMCAGMNVVYMELKLLLAMVLRKYRIRLECPDMLARCGRLFPYLMPEKGTDNVILEPREAPDS